MTYQELRSIQGRLGWVSFELDELQQLLREYQDRVIPAGVLKQLQDDMDFIEALLSAVKVQVEQAIEQEPEP